MASGVLSFLAMATSRIEPSSPIVRSLSSYMKVTW